MGFSLSIFLVVLFPFKQVSGFSVCFLRRVFGSTENRHSLQKFSVFTSKIQEVEQGLRKGALSLGLQERSERHLFVPSECTGQTVCPKTGMLDHGHGGPSSPKAVPYPWHRSLIKWPGQKKARVFNGDLCGQMTEEWRSLVLCSI